MGNMTLRDIYRTRAEGKHPKSIRVILVFDDGSKTIIEYERDYPLRYGTNPHQPSAEYSFKEAILTLQEIKTGKSGMSQTNREDLLHAFSILKYFSNPACAVMKHLNPSGVAVKETGQDAFIHAWNCDYQAAFGGVVVFNKPINIDTAHATEDKYIEVIAAPEFDDGVLNVFEKKKDLRVIKISGIDSLPKFVGDETVPNIKGYEGRLFLETPYLTKIRSIDDLRNRDMGKLPAIVSEREPNEQELNDMLNAWYVCAAVRSNGIVLWKNGYSVGIGTGQQDRVTAVRQAIEKNKFLNEKERGDYNLDGAVIASDGLFPFPDSIEACGEAKISTVIQPGGSVKDGDVIKTANKYKMSMVFTGERCFSHH